MKLFVYGTLKQGYGNNRILDGATFLGNTQAPGALYTGYSFPMAVQGEGTIQGELWEINKEHLAMCDRLESHPRMYKRTEVRLLNGVQAYIYYWQGATGGLRYLPNGEWNR